MARLILKSPYLQCDGNHSASGYLRYIGTRERVELIPDDRPPTRKQEQLVRKLTKDFPEAKELGEYLDYEAKPTKANASAFITRTLEENWSAVQQSDGYMKYIATRPRAERLGDHGLFGDEDGVDLDQAMDELDHCTGNVWTHIISLKRGDAARLGYDDLLAGTGQHFAFGAPRTGQAVLKDSLHGNSLRCSLFREHYMKKIPSYSRLCSRRRMLIACLDT